MSIKKDNKKILLIGAGQLGSRHLQALALLKQSCAIIVVDTNENSLKIAKLRFEEIKGSEKHKVSYQTEIKNSKFLHFNLCIIATNSKIRSLIIKELFNEWMEHVKFKKFEI